MQKGTRGDGDTGGEGDVEEETAMWAQERPIGVNGAKEETAMWRRQLLIDLGRKSKIDQVWDLILKPTNVAISSLKGNTKFGQKIGGSSTRQILSS